MSRTAAPIPSPCIRSTPPRGADRGGISDRGGHRPGRRHRRSHGSLSLCGEPGFQRCVGLPSISAGTLTPIVDSPFSVGAEPASLAHRSQRQFSLCHEFQRQLGLGIPDRPRDRHLERHLRLAVCGAAQAPVSIAIDPTEAFAFVANNTPTKHCFRYTLNATTGALTPSSGRPSRREPTRSRWRSIRRAAIVFAANVRRHESGRHVHHHAGQRRLDRVRPPSAAALSTDRRGDRSFGAFSSMRRTTIRTICPPIPRARAARLHPSPARPLPWASNRIRSRSTSCVVLAVPSMASPRSRMSIHDVTAGKHVPREFNVIIEIPHELPIP